jgi:hypothetical protein
MVRREEIISRPDAASRMQGSLRSYSGSLMPRRVFMLVI